MEEILQDNGLSLQIRELVRVAKGDIPSDILLKGGRLVNVYSGEILDGFSVAIKGERIATVGKDLDYTIGSKTEVIDLDGMTMIPGLIDAHTHLLMYCPLHETIEAAIRHGTTTILSEAIELAFPYGTSGIMAFLEWIRNQPIKIYATIPIMHTLSPSSKKNVISISDLKRLLKEDNVLGLGETVWNYVINGDKRTCDFIAETLLHKKLVEGHAAGARGKHLSAFASSGVSSCHESINVEDVIERVRYGMYAMIREGDIRRELREISKIKDMGIELRRCILVSDGLSPRTFLEQGYMDNILQKAIDLGIDPIKAIQMVTLNPSEHLGLDHIIGGIAPHRCADVVVVPDVKEIKPVYVISNGKIVLRHGDLTVQPRIPSYIKSIPSGISLLKIAPSDFAIKCSLKNRVKVRVIDLFTPLVTKERIEEMPVKNSEIKVDLSRDIVKVSMLTRDKRFVGLIKGFGIKKGAIATSAIWDACGIVVVGAHEIDMANAVNRVVDMGGGIAVSEGGKIISELPMPIGGILSDLPSKEISERLEDIQKKVESFGCRLPDAHLSISILTTPYIPFLRISEEGLFDLKGMKRANFIIS